MQAIGTLIIFLFFYYPIILLMILFFNFIFYKKYQIEKNVFLQKKIKEVSVFHYAIYSLTMAVSIGVFLFGLVNKYFDVPVAITCLVIALVVFFIGYFVFFFWKSYFYNENKSNLSHVLVFLFVLIIFPQLLYFIFLSFERSFIFGFGALFFVFGLIVLVKKSIIQKFFSISEKNVLKIAKAITVSFSVIFVFCALVFFNNYYNDELSACSTSKALNWYYRQSFVITEKNVCYHKNCETISDPTKLLLCKWHKKFFGYKEIKGADPKTFLPLKMFSDSAKKSFAVDKNNFYFKGEKYSEMGFEKVAYFSGFFRSVCEDIEKTSIYCLKDDIENCSEDKKRMCEELKKICKIFNKKFEFTNNQVRKEKTPNPLGKNQPYSP